MTTEIAILIGSVAVGAVCAIVLRPSWQYVAFGIGLVIVFYGIFYVLMPMVLDEPLLEYAQIATSALLIGAVLVNWIRTRKSPSRVDDESSQGRK